MEHLPMENARQVTLVTPDFVVGYDNVFTTGKYSSFDGVTWYYHATVSTWTTKLLNILGLPNTQVY